MSIPFLLALFISSRRANSLLHFLKCVLSRLIPPCVPVITCFMINLHFVQVTVVFSSFYTKNFHTKDLLTCTRSLKKRWQIFRIRTTFSFPIIFSFRHWSFTTIFFQIHVQV
ncbi:hypothetical protein H5410_063461 [Solanum commersonii]|uniref:Uncharacterized protein n=1 Tax=Solanum commersonii TaxID=4109 RepID=A0A9J5WEE0_SOLCO|nr:hypothetical protein H5410_063461 [Solanum commersonii]